MKTKNLFALLLTLGSTAVFAEPPPPVISESIPDDAVNPNFTIEMACQKGYSEGTDADGNAVRNVAPAVHRDVYKSAGVVEGTNPDQCVNGKGGAYEVDHRISLMIGGTNNRSNLTLQEYCGDHNAHQKDVLELYVRNVALCKEHSVTLRQAQEMLYLNWAKTYDELLAAGKIKAPKK